MSGLVIFDICEGNPGAMTFVMDACNSTKSIHDAVTIERAFQKMYDAGITGDKLYMLWNDCCDRNTEKAVEIMLNKDIEEIIKHINYEGGRGFAFEE